MSHGRRISAQPARSPERGRPGYRGAATAPRRPRPRAPTRSGGSVPDTWLPTPVASSQSEGKRTRRLAPLHTSTQRRIFKIEGEFQPTDPRRAPFAEELLPWIRPRGRGSPPRCREPRQGRRRPGESPRNGPRPSEPPRAAEPPSARSRRAAVSRASTAPGARWAGPPRPPPPAKSGAARPLPARRQSRPRAAHAQSPRGGRASERVRAARPEPAPPSGSCRQPSRGVSGRRQRRRRNRPAEPGEPDSGRGKRRRAPLQVIKTSIKVRPRVRGAHGFPEVP